MNVERVETLEAVRQWAVRSDRFLEAAEFLPVGREDMHQPRNQLLSRAVEYRLKAYLCAARGGAPDTGDLSRLAALAAHCGLVLSSQEQQRIARLDRCAFAAEGEVTMPGLDWVPALCAAIDRQMRGLSGAGSTPA